MHINQLDASGTCYNYNENDKKFLSGKSICYGRTPYNGTKFTYSRISPQNKILHYYFLQKKRILFLSLG